MATQTNMQNIAANTAFAPMMEALNEYVVQFLTEQKDHKRASVDRALKYWQKSSTQQELAALVQAHAPKAPKAKRTTKNKGPKDKNAPKGARSAYILFCGDERDAVVKENPEMKAADVLKELGARWKALKASEHKKDQKKVKAYEKAAEKDKARAAQALEEYKSTEEFEAHEKAVEEWKAQGSPALGRKGGKKRAPKDKNAPKGARSAYILFCGDARASVVEDYPEMKAADVLKELGARWKALSDKQKRPYEKAAKKDKKRFDKEMAAYEKTAEYKEHQVVKAAWEAENGTPKRKSSKKSNKDPNAPKKARSAYIFFGKDMRQGVKDDHPDWDNKEVTRELSRMWKEDYADEEARAKWNKMAKDDKKRYRKEFKAYTPPDEDEDAVADVKSATEDEDTDAEEVESAPSSPKKSPKNTKAKRTVKAQVQVKAAPVEEDSDDSESDGEDGNDDSEAELEEED